MDNWRQRTCILFQFFVYRLIFLCISILKQAYTPIQYFSTSGLISVCTLQELGWQERSPQSLNKDYEIVETVSTASTAASQSSIAPNTAVPKLSLTRLQDVFISVKTTGHYHKWRLPVILKTWFQLAKDQVRESIHCSTNCLCMNRDNTT